MPHSQKQKPSRLKAATFCLGIYLCSFFVVNQYSREYHPGQSTSGSANRATFTPSFSHEAQVWYEDYCHRQIQQQSLSVKTMQAKLQRNPRNAELHFQFAELLNQQKGQEAQTVDQYRQAIDLQPKKTLYHLAFATMLQQHGRGQEALAQFQAAAKCAQHPINAQYEVGCLLCKQGKKSEGIAILTKISNSSDRFWSLAAASHLRSLTQASLHA